MKKSNVKNPKTTAQTLQRVLVKVVAMCYTMLKTICNHSFENVGRGFASMNKFKIIAAELGPEPDPVLPVHSSSK